LIDLTRNNIHAYRALGRQILIIEVDSKIFDEVLKPFLDVKSGENVFNLDDDSPIEKKTKINFNCE
jgi:hypothetical protein